MSDSLQERPTLPRQEVLEVSGALLAVLFATEMFRTEYGVPPPTGLCYMPQGASLRLARSLQGSLDMHSRNSGTGSQSPAKRPSPNLAYLQFKISSVAS